MVAQSIRAGIMEVTIVCKRTNHLNHSEVVYKGRYIEQRMRGNPHFPDAGPLLDDLHARTDALAAANVACWGGGKLVTARRNFCRLELENQFNVLVGHVHTVSGGQPAVAATSGFPLRKPAKRIGKLPAPQRLSAKRTLHSGQVLLGWKRMPGAREFFVYMNPDGPSNREAWKHVGRTKASKFLVVDLEPGKIVWFQVCAVNAAGWGPMSVPVSWITR